MIARDPSGYEAEARLAEAVETGETVEVILVLRGTLRRASHPGRWHMRLADGRTRTITADTVVAVTPVARRGR